MFAKLAMEHIVLTRVAKKAKVLVYPVQIGHRSPPPHLQHRRLRTNLIRTIRNKKLLIY